MIELLEQYWRPFLYSDGQHITGLAMTLWLLSASIFFGFLVSVPLSIARVSPKRRIRWPVEFYTYLFRGTPLYIQLLICYTGIYSLEAVRDQPLLNSFFRDAMNCTILAFALNTCAYTTEIFAGILMLHSTTVAFTATIPDILKVARDANSATYMTFQSFGIAALIYLAITFTTFTLVGLFRLAERRWLAFLGPAH